MSGDTPPRHPSAGLVGPFIPLLQRIPRIFIQFPHHVGQSGGPQGMRGGETLAVGRQREVSPCFGASHKTLPQPNSSPQHTLPNRELCSGYGAPKTFQAFLHLRWAVPLSLKFGMVWKEGKEPGVLGGDERLQEHPRRGAGPVFQACMNTARSESHADTVPVAGHSAHWKDILEPQFHQLPWPQPSPTSTFPALTIMKAEKDMEPPSQLPCAPHPSGEWNPTQPSFPAKGIAGQ